MIALIVKYLLVRWRDRYSCENARVPSFY